MVKKMRLETRIAFGVLVLIMLLLQASISTSARTKPKQQLEQGRAIFMSNCEACHLLSGENVIKPKKPISRSEKLESEEIFQEFLMQRHGVMPEFPQIAKDEQLVKSLYRFVKKLKNQSWQYPEEPELIQKK